MENVLIEPCCSNSIQKEKEMCQSNSESEMERPVSTTQTMNGNVLESTKVQVIGKNGKYTSIHLQEPNDEDKMKAERDLMAQFEWNNREVIMICLIMFLGSITLGLIIAHIQASKSMALKQEDLDNCSIIAITYRGLLQERNASSHEQDRSQNKKHIVFKNFRGVVNEVSSDAESVSYDHSRASFSPKWTKSHSICQAESCIVQNQFDYWKSVQSQVESTACQDFQSHACGQWLTSRYPKLLNSSTGSWSIYDELQETVERETVDFLKQPNDDASDNDAVRFARLQFRACLDNAARGSEGVGPLRDLLQQLCLIDDESLCSEIDSPTGLANFISKLHFKLGVNSLFKTFVAPAMWNASVNALYLALSSDNVTPLLHLASQAQRERFQQFLKLDKLFLRSGLSDLSHVGRLLYNLNFQYEDADDASYRSWKRIDVEELQNTIPQINWREFLSFAGGNIPLMIRQSLLRGLHSVLNQVSVRQKRHYFTWSVVNAWWQYLDASRVDLYNTVIMDLQNRSVSTKEATWKICLKMLDKETLSAIYEQRIHPTSAFETEQYVLPIIMEWIRKAWLDELRSVANFSVESQTFLLNKIKSIKIRSTSFGSTAARKQLDFTKILMSEEQSFFNLTLALQQQQLLREKSMIVQSNKMSSDESFIDTTQVNAFYARQNHLIQLPRAHLRWPFLVSGENWMNRFASLGTLIAHEIYHALDSEGGCFSSNGSLSSICHVYPQLMQRKCILREWKMENDGGKLSASNEGLEDELLADTYGLHIAFKAYKMWSRVQSYEEKRSSREFFFHYAQTNCGLDNKQLLSNNNMVQTHASWKDRINIPLKFLTVFQQEFQCENVTSTIVHKSCKL